MLQNMCKKGDSKKNEPLYFDTTCRNISSEGVFGQGTASLGFSMLELLLVVSLLGGLALMKLWNTRKACETYNRQLLRESVNRLNDYVEVYALYYVQETEEAVPTWTSKEDILKDLKTALPKSRKIVLQNTEMEKFLPQINWNAGTQRFE